MAEKKKGKKAEAAPLPVETGTDDGVKSEKQKRPSFLDLYEKEAVPGLMEHFKYTNKFQVPRLQRIVVNMGMGSAVGNPKVIDTAVNELGAARGSGRSSRGPRRPSQPSSCAKACASASA